uniref:Uncharacterized protein n=1 Tax=Tanacetum cinerariifolium TaxID=118510 RepID=A0A6L2KW22_TANCI|nr:hypothetical protein [Tanacetum cinerariifolium]
MGDLHLELKVESIKREYRDCIMGVFRISLFMSLLNATQTEPAASNGDLIVIVDFQSFLLTINWCYHANGVLGFT